MTAPLIVVLPMLVILLIIAIALTVSYFEVDGLTCHAGTGDYGIDLVQFSGYDHRKLMSSGRQQLDWLIAKEQLFKNLVLFGIQVKTIAQNSYLAAHVNSIQ